jgi:AAA15 family ATPase/GTPase
MALQDHISNKRFTVLLGKNGAGKSTMLRALDSNGAINTKYVTPERGGTLKYDPNIETNISRNENWLATVMRKNRFEQFRQQSAYKFRNLEILVLREIEKKQELRADSSYTFETTIQSINDLLPAVKIARSDRGFTVSSKVDDQNVPEDSLSSGESELIALGIEVLVFARESQVNKYLLLDEPDVHLHPDLQQRFIEFVEATAKKYDFRVVIATHSTAIIGAFRDQSEVQIIPVLSRDQAEFYAFNYDPVCHEILPIFGAHPLSSQFNRAPVILVEGEDDKRVIDQLVRSSRGKVLLSPCVVGTVSELNRWEAWLNSVLPSIYDQPRAYSLRDLDDAETCDIDDVGIVTRAKLNCYAIENLLVSDECLAQHGFSEDGFIAELRNWVASHPRHQASDDVGLLAEMFTARRTKNLKSVRNVLVALLGSQKPWEVLVGQLLAANREVAATSENSLKSYLGNKAVRVLFG